MEEEEVTILRSEYEKLLSASEKLDALERAGVDNWSGYEEAMSELAKEKEEEAAIQEAMAEEEEEFPEECEECPEEDVDEDYVDPEEVAHTQDVIYDAMKEER